MNPKGLTAELQERRKISDIAGILQQPRPKLSHKISRFEDTGIVIKFDNRKTCLSWFRTRDGGKRISNGEK